MKKVLALIVAFALCFTAFAGCFATSAAAPLSFTITGSIADDNGAATVTVSGSYEIRTAQLLTVTLDSNLKFEGVVNGINIDKVDNVTDETPENLYSVEGNVIKFLDDYTGNFEIVINVTAPANDGATDATYAVTASADIAGWDDTEVSSVDPVTAVVTVKAAVPEHTCDFDEYAYDVVDGSCVTTVTCDCGEAKTFTVANTDITQFPYLDADLSADFCVPTEALTGYTTVYATFDKEGFDNDADFDIVTKSTVDEEEGLTSFYFGKDETTEEGNEIGITSKQMSNNVDCRIYGTNAEGYVVLIAQEIWSMRSYIERQYDVIKPYADAYGKTGNAAYLRYRNLAVLLVDLANYGAQAQKTFNYNVENLANANVDTTTYFTELRDDYVNTNTISGIEFSPSPDLANKVLVDLIFPQSSVAAGATLKVNYTNKQGEADTITVGYDNFVPYDTNNYTVTFDKYVAPSLGTAIDFTMYDAENNVLGTGDFDFESYAARLKVFVNYGGQYATRFGPYYAAVQYMLAYGTSAAAYFNV